MDATLVRVIGAEIAEGSRPSLCAGSPRTDDAGRPPTRVRSSPASLAPRSPTGAGRLPTRARSSPASAAPRSPRTCPPGHPRGALPSPANDPADLPPAALATRRRVRPRVRPRADDRLVLRPRPAPAGTPPRTAARPRPSPARKSTRTAMWPSPTRTGPRTRTAARPRPAQAGTHPHTAARAAAGRRPAGTAPAACSGRNQPAYGRAVLVARSPARPTTRADLTPGGTRDAPPRTLSRRPGPVDAPADLHSPPAPRGKRRGAAAGVGQEDDGGGRGVTWGREEAGEEEADQCQWRRGCVVFVR